MTALIWPSNCNFFIKLFILINSLIRMTYLKYLFKYKCLLLIPTLDWTGNLGCCRRERRRGLQLREREGGGVWVSLLLFGREKEERFPVVAVAADGGVRGGRRTANRLEGSGRVRSLRDFRFCLL